MNCAFPGPTATRCCSCIHDSVRVEMIRVCIYNLKTAISAVAEKPRDARRILLFRDCITHKNNIWPTFAYTTIRSGGEFVEVNK